MTNTTRREWLALTGAGLAGCAAPPRQEARQDPPNIVFLFADDMGYADLGCYGSPDIQTPRIDALAAEGVRYTQAYSNGPECSPTRTAFFSGRYQQRVGGMECAIGIGNVGRYDDAIWLAEQGQLGLPVEENRLVPALKSAGYHTGCFGKWHLGYDDHFHANRHGFDEFLGIAGGNCDYFTHREQDGAATFNHNGEPEERSGYMTNVIADAALAWLDSLPEGEPYFLYVPFTVPHTPIQGPEDTEKVATPENFNEGERTTYVRMVEHLDERVGDILDALGENTLVVFASDNGGTRHSDNGIYRGNKSSLWEGGIRVPMMVRWPGKVRAGGESDAPVMTFDLTATMLEAAGVPRTDLDGVSLLAHMSEAAEALPERVLFWRSKRGTRFRRAVRDGAWKYVWDDGAEELHNLAEDPTERVDRRDDSPEVLAALKEKLTAWEIEVMAPRLRPFRSEPG